MPEWYKKIFILPHYVLGVAWLMGSACVLFPFFFLTGFYRPLMASFAYFQGRVVYRLLRPVVHDIQINRQPDTPSPCIYIANHQSVMDAFVFSFVGLKNVVCVSKNWVFRIPFYGCYLRRLGFINAEESDFETMRSQVAELLKTGVSVAFFPEGTRCRQLGRFHSAPFHIAISVGAKIVPLCIDGHDRMLPPKSRLPRPAYLHYHILSAINSADFDWDGGALKLAQNTKRVIMEKLVALNINSCKLLGEK